MNKKVVDWFLKISTIAINRGLLDLLIEVENMNIILLVML